MNIWHSIKSRLTPRSRLDESEQALLDMLAWQGWEIEPDGRPRLVPPPSSYRELRSVVPHFVAYLDRLEQDGVYGAA